jgi:hypothetical protein
MRNLALTGSVTGGHPDWAALHIGRIHRSFSEVLSMTDFWRSLLWQFANSPEFLDRANVLLSVVPAACGFLFAFAYVLGLRGSMRQSATADVLLFGLILVCIVGVVAQQVLYVRTGGGVNARYFAMLLPLFSIAIAVGLTGVGRLGPWLVGAWLAMNAVDLLLDLRAVLGRVLKPPQANIYPAVAWTGFAVHIAALAVAFVFYVIWARTLGGGLGSEARKNREERLAARMATGAASTAEQT